MNDVTHNSTQYNFTGSSDPQVIDLAKHKKVYKNLFDSMWVFRSFWLEVQKFHSPYLGRNLWGIRDSYEDLGFRKDQYRINAAPWLAMNDLVSGFSEGLTPTTRPFFAFKLPDGNDDLMDDQMIQKWLFLCSRAVLSLMDKSGFYDEMKILYREVATFGTANMVIYDDPKQGAICQTDTIGEFVLGLGAHGKIDRTYRRKVYTVGQMVEEFGIDQVPASIKEAYRRGDVDIQWMVVNGIVPSQYWDPTADGQAGMEYDSFYFIEGKIGTDSQVGIGQLTVMDDVDKPMRQAKFRVKPNVTARMGVVGGQIYGISNVMEILGDIKQLQMMDSKKLKALDKMVDPAFMVPDSLRNFNLRANAGDINYYAPPMAPEQIFALYNAAQFNVQATVEEIQNVMQRIDRALFRDVFVAMTELGKLAPDATAYLSSKVWEEKISRIGPVVDSLERDVLKVAIDRFFDIAYHRGDIPPPPPSLPAGMELKIEYTSFLSQAKRQIGLSDIQQALAFNQQLMQSYPDAKYYFDAGEAQTEVNKSLGLNPKITPSKDDRAKMQAADQQQMQQAQQQQQMEALGNAAGAAQKLSQTKIGGKNALEHLAAAGGSQQ